MLSPSRSLPAVGDELCQVLNHVAQCLGAGVARDAHLELAVLLPSTQSPVQQVLRVLWAPSDREARAQNFRTRSMKDQRMQTVGGDVDIQILMNIMESDQKSKPEVLVDE